ncbi:MAG: STAS domain-containing protein [Thermoleophilia bacterium]|nr:STAS domain-containing protein [Thermoleophilia bacterium]MDH4340993.1 STAS domain-containing protein [Thermoleophilia bacterium]MDH5280080.1 STAS domain-containing protein [Thermoleophilia bacterium]
MTKVRTFSSEPISVRRVGASVWILRLRESLEFRAAAALREAFGEAIRRDANDVVVDLATADSVSAEGAAVLGEMADLMRSRNGALWIAAPGPGGDSYTLRPVRESAPGGLTGVSAALDGALSELSKIRTGYSVREASAILADRFEEPALYVSDFAGVPA